MADARWIAASVASLLAVGVVGVALARPEPATSSVVIDADHDVNGLAADELEAVIDIARASVTKSGDGFVLVIDMHDPIVRSRLAEVPATYDVRLRGSEASYLVRAVVGEQRVEAGVFGRSTGDRPFVLDAPKIAGTRVELRVPAEAVESLGRRFTWAVTTSLAGSEDTAPSDLAARYPGGGQE